MHSNKKGNNKIYNAGSGKPIAVKKVINTIKKLIKHGNRYLEKSL